MEVINHKGMPGQALKGRREMKTFKGVVGWVGFVAMLMFCLFVAWDYATVRIRDHERRISALEREARPLIIVDRFSHVYLNGDPVYGGALEEKP